MSVTPEHGAGTQQRHRRQIDDRTERGEQITAVTHQVPVVSGVYCQPDGQKTTEDDAADATQNPVPSRLPFSDWTPGVDKGGHPLARLNNLVRLDRDQIVRCPPIFQTAADSRPTQTGPLGQGADVDVDWWCRTSGRNKIGFSHWKPPQQVSGGETRRI